MPSKIGLGIDAGGSSTRWLLLDSSGAEVGRGETLPITGHLFAPGDRESNLSRLRELLRDVQLVAAPDAVVAGITGTHSGTNAASLLRDAVAKVLELELGSVRITNDMEIAYASVFTPGEGVLVYAGTGSVGYHVRPDLSAVSAGGYGHLVDDAGAGYWIGHEGLKQTLRWADESGSPSTRPLAQEVYGTLGSTEWREIIGVLYGGGRSPVASLAPAVKRAADKGDDTAKAILTQAGRELARLARTVTGRVGTVLPVALAGGIAEIGRPLVDAFADALPLGTPWRVAQLRPTQAAARSALALCSLVSGAPS